MPILKSSYSCVSCGNTMYGMRCGMRDPRLPGISVVKCNKCSAKTFICLRTGDRIPRPQIISMLGLELWESI